MEYILISLFLSRIIHSNIAKRLILILILPYSVLCIYDHYANGNASFSSFLTIIEFFVFIIFIIFFLFEKMRYSFFVPIYQTINFWICVGLFVYFTGSFFYVLLVTSSSKDPNSKNELIIIYGLVTIVKNLILSFALFNDEKEDISHQNELIIPTDINLDNFTQTNNLN